MSISEFIKQDNEKLEEIGLSWRKAGKLNRGFCIPTGLFVRWYTKGVY